eukprot:m.321463 g.321463  ORF g.321463 m.321463 type:complete len:132 (+) comp15997_c0_seq1:185-580(+)
MAEGGTSSFADLDVDVDVDREYVELADCYVNAPAQAHPTPHYIDIVSGPQTRRLGFRRATMLSRRRCSFPRKTRSFHLHDMHRNHPRTARLCQSPPSNLSTTVCSGRFSSRCSLISNTAQVCCSSVSVFEQ